MTFQAAIFAIKTCAEKNLDKTLEINKEHKPRLSYKTQRQIQFKLIHF